MVELNKKSKLVGDFIKKRREGLGISQRMLGLRFDPPVTTQFISNVERGVTPLPPVHILILAKALDVNEAEILSLLEREYVLRINGRLGKTDADPGVAPVHLPSLMVANGDYDFMKSLYESYRGADIKTKQAFVTVCESILRVPKANLPQ